MAIVVNTNVDSLVAQRNLSNATGSLSKAMERLATGLKINRAADDAAGMVISKGLESQQRGSVVAKSNAQMGTSLLQTAEGNLDVIQDNMLRIRDLTLQALNGTNTAEEKEALGAEVTQRLNEIDRISNGAKFNEFKLFEKDSTDATATVKLQVGASSDSATNTISVDNVFVKATSSALTGNATLKADATAAFTGAAGTTDAALRTFLDDIDTGVKEISTRRGTIGAATNRLESAMTSLDIQNENLLAANSRIKDADVAAESANLVKYQILQQVSTAILSQANQAPGIALSLV